MNYLTGKHILLGVTGGIAAYKAAELVRQLRLSGAMVRVVMTAAATEFITPLTLQTLSGNRVLLNQFDGVNQEWDVKHVSLARRSGRCSPSGPSSKRGLPYGTKYLPGPYGPPSFQPPLFTPKP